MHFLGASTLFFFFFRKLDVIEHFYLQIRIQRTKIIRNYFSFPNQYYTGYSVIHLKNLLTKIY